MTPRWSITSMSQINNNVCEDADARGAQLIYIACPDVDSIIKTLSSYIQKPTNNAYFSSLYVYPSTWLKTCGGISTSTYALKHPSSRTLNPQSPPPFLPLIPSPTHIHTPSPLSSPLSLLPPFTTKRASILARSLVAGTGEFRSRYPLQARARVCVRAFLCPCSDRVCAVRDI